MPATEKTIEIFDTTLRDGEQTPGLSFTLDEKIQVAWRLDELGIDVIEAGFPRSSSDERRAVQEIQSAVNTKVCALARITERDIEEALATGAEMIHVFASSSDIQLEKSMNMGRGELLDKSKRAVRQIVKNDRECMFSPMDATRTEPKQLKQLCNSVEKAGADIINVPDTVGVATPRKMRSLISMLSECVHVPLSVHCHDDFGLAVANTIAAVEAGARQVQVTVNGIGERAGNASLEETVMSLECLEDCTTGINTQSLFEICKFVERLSGIQVPPMKPIVGENAFSHESGIHAAGVLEDKDTFEPGVMSPEMVGHRRRFIVGKHAGRQGLRKVLDDAGLHPTEEELKAILRKAKRVSGTGKKLTEADLYALAETEMEHPSEGDKLVEIDQVFVTSGYQNTPTATVEASVKGQKITEAATGVGPVDAVFQAFRNAIGEEKSIDIVEFHLDAITGGSDAIANVTVRIEDEWGQTTEASGTREDIVLASVEALVNAINHLARKSAKDNGECRKVTNRE
ncbi:MAG: 2-isopropylmalate synthase [Candidatus Acetothermia bacterium]